MRCRTEISTWKSINAFISEEKGRRRGLYKLQPQSGSDPLSHSLWIRSNDTVWNFQMDRPTFTSMDFSILQCLNNRQQWLTWLSFPEGISHTMHTHHNFMFFSWSIKALWQRPFHIGIAILIFHFWSWSKRVKD